MPLYFQTRGEHIANMATPQIPPQIFDHGLARIRRARAAKRGPSFLIERCAQDAADRVSDINRVFERALILGSKQFIDSVIAFLPQDNKPFHINSGTITETENGIVILNPKGESAISGETYDLIISGLRLQTANDLPGVLYTLKDRLRPDGLFLGAMFGGETLTQLRQSFYATDEKIMQGMAAHIFPFADYSQAAALLQRSGFALPVIDTDRFTVSYKAFQTLIDDLRDLGETNSLTARRNAYLGKAFKSALTAHYFEAFSKDGKYPATFEILWLTGWAPHDSQQKPLKPGSAKMRLADALKSTETKL